MLEKRLEHSAPPVATPSATSNALSMSRFSSGRPLSPFTSEAIQGAEKCLSFSMRPCFCFAAGMAELVTMGLYSIEPMFNGKGEPGFWRRILTTFLLLLLFRVLGQIPVLNVDPARLQHLLANNPSLGLIDLFAGGTVLTHFSMAAAGLFPFLVALLVAHFLTWTVPRLRALRTQGDKGQKRIDFIAQILTVPLALLFAIAISKYLAIQTGLFPGGVRWFTAASFLPTARVVLLVTVGSLATARLTDMITKKGIGRGENLVLLTGACLTLAKQAQTAGHNVAQLIALGFGAAIMVALIVLLTGAQRRIPVKAAKRADAARNSYETSPTEIPFQLISGGVMPISGALGLVTLTQIGVSFLALHFGMAHSGAGGMAGWSWAMLALLIAACVYLYNFSLIEGWTAGDDLTAWDRMKRTSEFIPGVRPGAATKVFLEALIARMSFLGALGTVVLAAGVPYAVYRLLGVNIVTQVLSLFILVQTFVQLRSEVISYKLQESYSGLLRRAKGRRPGSGRSG